MCHLSYPSTGPVSWNSNTYLNGFSELFVVEINNHTLFGLGISILLRNSRLVSKELDQQQPNSRTTTHPTSTVCLFHLTSTTDYPRAVV